MPVATGWHADVHLLIASFEGILTSEDTDALASAVMHYSEASEGAGVRLIADFSNLEAIVSVIRTGARVANLIPNSALAEVITVCGENAHLLKHLRAYLPFELAGEDCTFTTLDQALVHLGQGSPALLPLQQTPPPTIRHSA